MKKYYDNYFIQNTYSTTNFSFLFEDCVDKIISSILPIQYEFQLENHKLPINYSLLKQYPFLSNIILPKLREVIRDNRAFLEIEALQIKTNHETYYNLSPMKVYSNDGVILLNEKSFEAIRRRILFIFFIKLIDDSSKFELWDKSLLNLSSFVSYYFDKGYQFFTIYFAFDNMLCCLGKNSKIDQLEFWFCFYIQMLDISIDTIEYDFFFCDMTQFNSDEFKCQLINIYYEYIAFVQKSLSDIKCNSAIVTMTNNIYWIEEINERLNNESLIAYIKSLQLRIYTNLSLISRMSQAISFSHLVLNFYGKYSNIKWKEYVSICLKENDIRMININIFEFSQYEYLKMIKLQKEEMLLIEQTAIELFFHLTRLIKEMNAKSKSILITLQVKKFTSYKSYLKTIMTAFNSMMKEIIDSGHNVIIYFSNIVENLTNCNMITCKQKTYSPHLMSSDLTFSNQSLFLDCYSSIAKLRKITKIGSRLFQLSLFEKNIKVMMNKTLDYFYFRNYKWQLITNLTLGYFEGMKDLIVFMEKLALNSMSHLTKSKFYLKTNNGFVYQNISSLFALNWPRNSLKEIKFIYESHSAFHNFDVFTLYQDILMKKYFAEESPLLRAQSDMRQLPSINDTSFISQFMIQGNHSMLMDMTQLAPLDHSKNKSSMYPLLFIGFMRIETYLLYKINTRTLHHLALSVNSNRAFDKSIEKKKLKDRFLNSVVISEYLDVKANCLLLCALMKYDRKNRTKIVKQLMTKIITHHFCSGVMIIQYVFRFLKGRRCFFNDFYNSDKVFNKYTHVLGKGFE